MAPIRLQLTVRLAAFCALSLTLGAPLHQALFHGNAPAAGEHASQSVAAFASHAAAHDCASHRDSEDQESPGSDEHKDCPWCVLIAQQLATQTPTTLATLAVPDVVSMVVESDRVVESVPANSWSPRGPPA